MDDNGEGTGYFVCGEKKAVVIDTMKGIARQGDHRSSAYGSKYARTLRSLFWQCVL